MMTPERRKLPAALAARLESGKCLTQATLATLDHRLRRAVESDAIRLLLLECEEAEIEIPPEDGTQTFQVGGGLEIVVVVYAAALERCTLRVFG